MKQRKISDEEMELLEQQAGKVNDEIELALQKQEQERQLEEERKLRQSDVDAKNKLAVKIEDFLLACPNFLNRMLYAASYIDAQKFKKDLDPEMKVLAKELIAEIKKGVQPEFDRIMKVKNRVYLTRIWAYVLGFTLFWTLAFIAVITSWNFYQLHSDHLWHIIWGFIGVWIFTIGLWVFLWHKYQWE